MKLVMLVIMVLLLGAGMRYARPYIMRAAGVPETVSDIETPAFSSEEANLMSTVLRSAMRLFSGSASRDELAGELSDKLYSGRAGAGDMSELGIELVKPGSNSSAPTGGANVANSQPGAKPAASKGAPGEGPNGVPAKRPNGAPAKRPADAAQATLLARFKEQAKANSVELVLIPVVLLGMILVQRFRRRSRPDDFVPAGLAIQTPAECEPYDMKHAVHSLMAEDFELLVALIYQRQGYRVSMPAGLGGGRGGDFTLLRKSERVLMQCKKLNSDHRVPVERVREFHEAVIAAGATRGMYVASCGFTWDARNFAKANGLTLINARILDELLKAARETPEEDLLAVSHWLPKLMSKVKLTPPLCPACEAGMDEISASNGSVWVCSQRPECRGRRSARKLPKPAPGAACNSEKHVEEVNV